jgi:predicted acyl esterase
MKTAGTTAADRAAHDKPWHRPGPARYALARLRGLVAIPVTVTEPESGALVTAHDVAVSTVFRRGERLQLVVAARWLSPRNPLTGQFPAAYRTRKAGACTIHSGPDQDSHLLALVIPSP